MTPQDNIEDRVKRDLSLRERIGLAIIEFGLNVIAKFGAWVAGWDAEISHK